MLLAVNDVGARSGEKALLDQLTFDNILNVFDTGSAARITLA